MKTYETLDELYLDLLNDLLNAPVVSSRIGSSQEILGWSARLTDPTACFLANPGRALPPYYPAAELVWYLSGSDTLEMISAYAPSYAKYANEDRCHGAYGKRWTDDLAFQQTLEKMYSIQSDRATQQAKRAKSDIETARILNGKRCLTQIATVIQILGTKPDSRQAVMTAWNAGDLLYSLAGTKGDIPCTLSLQFLLRDGKLNLITTMRSNDVWLGVPNDFFCFCHLQMLVAAALKVELGWYQHNVGSMHLYERNKDKALNAALPSAFDVEPLSYVQSVTPISEGVQELLKVEKWNRENNTCSSYTDSLGANSLFGQIAYMLASRWSEPADKFLNMKTVRRAAERTRKSP